MYVSEDVLKTNPRSQCYKCVGDESVRGLGFWKASARQFEGKTRNAFSVCVCVCDVSVCVSTYGARDFMAVQMCLCRATVPARSPVFSLVYKVRVR